MPPIRMPLEGPFGRSVREALESVASPDAAQRVIAEALALAGRTAIPEDTSPFGVFYEGPLRSVVVRALGAAAQEIVDERLKHVLRMAQSQVLTARRSVTVPPPRAVRPDDWEEEDSAIRMTPGAALERDLLTALGMPATSTAPTKRPSRPAPAAADTTLPATQPPPPSSALPTRVLMVTLDPTLVHETHSGLAGACPIAAIASMQDLLAAVRGARGRIAVVVDTALPSIDVPTVASLATAFPEGTIVILWGMTDRQKERLVGMFPITASWIASATGRSPADLLATR